jgi:sugar phosphate isomerase/epimerase
VVERLAPHAPAGHVKDFAFRSLPNADGHHRHGFELLYVYPGEGVADLAALMGALRRGIDGREFFLAVEGLDDSPDAEPRERLRASLELLRRL